MASRRNHDEIYGRPGFLLRRCHQLSVAVFLEECDRFGLTPTQYGVLTALYLNPDIDQIGVGRILGHDRTTVGTVVDRLEARGLVTRSVDPQDRRKRQLALSPEGRRIQYEASKAVDRAQARLFTGLSEPERTKLLTLLQRVLDTADGRARAEIEQIA